MKERKYRDHRVKRKVFPLSTFFFVYVIFAFLATMHMQILRKYLDYQNIPTENAIAIFAVWMSVAVVFTLSLNFYINLKYQKPIEKVSEAARKVTSGDFTVQILPDHKDEEATQIDVLISDFNTMVKELGSTEILKTDFVSNVSHEFKSPLAIIRSNTEMLSNSSLTEKQQVYLQNITLAADRLNGLITNLLRLNKLENQGIQPRKNWFDLCLQLEECAVALETVWESKNIELEAELTEKCMIEADQELLSLVWLNLLSNAIKFTPCGGCVTLKLEETEHYVIVTVRDTGCGMDEDTKAHIFDKFYQGDTSHATEGNGLGLTLVQRILQITGSSLQVDSIPGQGSVFMVTLRKEAKPSWHEMIC